MEEEAIKKERLYVLVQLSSGVSHDFNNVLTPIIGIVDLILKLTKEKREKGTGMGLAIVSQIVNEYNDKIDIDSS